MERRSQATGGHSTILCKKSQMALLVIENILMRQIPHTPCKEATSTGSQWINPTVFAEIR